MVVADSTVAVADSTVAVVDTAVAVTGNRSAVRWMIGKRLAAQAASRFAFLDRFESFSTCEPSPLELNCRSLIGSADERTEACKPSGNIRRYQRKESF